MRLYINGGKFVSEAPDEPQNLKDCIGSTNTSRATVAKAIHNARTTMTILEMAKKTRMPVTTIRVQIKYFQYMGFTHISGWKHEHKGTWSAMYKAGSGDAVPRPMKQTPVRKMSIEQIKDKHAEKTKAGMERARKDSEHCVRLAKALVPVRDEDAQRQINQLYINWISEGTYD